MGMSFLTWTVQAFSPSARRVVQRFDGVFSSLFFLHGVGDMLCLVSGLIWARKRVGGLGMPCGVSMYMYIHGTPRSIGQSVSRLGKTHCTLLRWMARTRLMSRGVYSTNKNRVLNAQEVLHGPSFWIRPCESRVEESEWGCMTRRA
ncbi:hypothetical protein LY76DRAFT_126270 [Colletotrichum caudatum]|nr:hypothetical protein LY76DRAFT_126270 [Colletotrichum caudatum]